MVGCTTHFAIDPRKNTKKHERQIRQDLFFFPCSFVFFRGFSLYRKPSRAPKIVRLDSVLILLFLLPLTGCRQSATPSVKVAAAISTREALLGIAEQFRTQTGVGVQTNFGASSDLARQIEQGAECDLFLSADLDWMNYLQERDLVSECKNLLSNQLVIVVPVDSSLTIANLGDVARADIHRLALGGPAVPAGRYAREALQKAGLWEKFQSRALDGQDVRAALTYVAHHEAEAGIVYATDALPDAKVRVVFTIPTEFHKPIVYPLALIKRERMNEVARRLYDYLGNPECVDVFRRAGFRTIPDHQ
jgi:molybdate transport system substrate-binding protein